VDELNTNNELMTEKLELIGIMKERVDYLNRKAGERDSKIGRAMRDAAALDMTQSGAIRRLEERVEKIEEHCAACTCHGEKPKKKKAPAKKKK
jgi:hypothetical protein